MRSRQMRSAPRLKPPLHRVSALKSILSRNQIDVSPACPLLALSTLLFLLSLHPVSTQKCSLPIWRPPLALLRLRPSRRMYTSRLPFLLRSLFFWL